MDLSGCCFWLSTNLRDVRRFLPKQSSDELSPTLAMTPGVLFAAMWGFQKTISETLGGAGLFGLKTSDNEG
jgi:hypothetical protein